MPEEVKEPSMSDLRAMLTASAEPDATETPAPAAAAAADGETAPAPEPETQQEHERDEAGKFKGKEKAAEPAKEPEDSPGVKKRIGKLLEDKRRAEARAQELEAQLAKGSQPAADKPAETAKPAATAARPQAKDFDTYEAYVDALTDWKIDSRKAAEAKADSDRKAADTRNATLTAWQERVTKTREMHADFDAVLAEAETLPISLAMHETILEMDRGPEVAYALAQQPDEAKRIAKLGPYAAAAALGRIEAALPAAKIAASKDAPAKPAATAAKALPKPPAKVGGVTPAAIDLNDESLSQAVFTREFRKRLAAERS